MFTLLSSDKNMKQAWLPPFQTQKMVYGLDPCHFCLAWFKQLAHHHNTSTKVLYATYKLIPTPWGKKGVELLVCLFLRHCSCTLYCNTASCPS